MIPPATSFAAPVWVEWPDGSRSETLVGEWFLWKVRPGKLTYKATPLTFMKGAKSRRITSKKSPVLVVETPPPLTVHVRLPMVWPFGRKSYTVRKGHACTVEDATLRVEGVDGLTFAAS